MTKIFKRRLIIIPILTVTILFSSYHIQQKRAEALIPFILYVTVGLAINYLVGRYIYETIQGDIYMFKMMTYDSSTGAANLEWNENGYTQQRESIKQTPLTKNVYPETGGWEDNPVGSSLGGTLIDVAEFEEYQGSIISDTDLVALCDNWANADYCTVKEGTNIEGVHAKAIAGYSTDGVSGNINDTTLIDNPPLAYNPTGGGLGGTYSGTIDDFPIEFYEFLEDVPNLPNCFDGIQNQDETGIDCGGVCLINFGFDCPPPPETCNDGIMNQDETGIDYGGVCGTGDPVAPPAENFTDNNVDGVDDISGLDSGGSIPIAAPGNGDASTYDASLPGDVSEVGDTNWTGLITGYLASNPLVLLATGSQINITGAACSLPLTVFGKSMNIDFCSLEWMVELFGSFVLGLMAIRAVFIAMGI